MEVVAVDFDKVLINNKKVVESTKSQVNKEFENPENFIVIYTSRSYSQFFYIRQFLLENQIKFHAIVCEKMRADCYIDDKNKLVSEWMK